MGQTLKKQVMLPIEGHKHEIIQAVQKESFLLIKAPTGTGKSTCVPLYVQEALTHTDENVLVLEPRRMAAVGLASFIAELKGEHPGGHIGYQVRGDARISEHSKIIFQTYGMFTQLLLKNPALTHTSAVILDEFHERQLDMDLSLAWVHYLQKINRAPIKLIIMSATLDNNSFKKFMPGIPTLEVKTSSWPVETSWQRPQRSETVWEQAFRAFKVIVSKKVTGTVLIFMPGKFEIDKTESLLSDLCQSINWRLETLSGSQSLEHQKKILKPEITGGNRVIITTNVAESAVTIPGVTAVIDSGLARVAAYDPGRGVNTLNLQRISLASAAQRKGRAGRLMPGLCIRLWAREVEGNMTSDIVPEISSLDLSGLLLTVTTLLNTLESNNQERKSLEWLCTPEKVRWDNATSLLTKLGAIHKKNNLLPMGKKLSRYPLHPRLSRILEDARSEKLEHACAAMVAIVSGAHRKGFPAVDLIEQARSFVAREDTWPSDVHTTYRQLLTKFDTRSTTRLSATHHEKLIKIWMRWYADGLAKYTGQNNNYQLQNGRTVSLSRQTSLASDAPEVVIIIDNNEISGGNLGRRQKSQFWLVAQKAWVQETFPDECHWTPHISWDEKKDKIIIEENLFYGFLAFDTRPVSHSHKYQEQIEGLLADKLLNHDIIPKFMNEHFTQLLYRLQLLSKAYPEYDFPRMDNEDLELFYYDVCEGKKSLNELDKINFKAALTRYVPEAAIGMLNTSLPESTILKSGRKARYTYFSDTPPELSARLGDFIGMEGEHYLCEGRQKVLYNILAPNYRTVQKTADLSGFWKNTYPEIKKELKRRYPKHPWP
ncbi:MAG: DEAD/DEAH box helicase [Fibrobacteria bacterium]|nr:DEAD/DEAH box helicase [Fibrobacteria bacterium]